MNAHNPGHGTQRKGDRQSQPPQGWSRRPQQSRQPWPHTPSGSENPINTRLTYRQIPALITNSRARRANPTRANWSQAVGRLPTSRHISGPRFTRQPSASRSHGDLPTQFTETRSVHLIQKAGAPKEKQRAASRQLNHKTIKFSRHSNNVHTVQAMQALRG